MSISLYDVLDVAPSASAEEIRAAWRSAIADLGPGDRRFRAYNEAAEVLLDPARRAEYDAGLAAAEPEAAAAPQPRAKQKTKAPEKRKPKPAAMAAESREAEHGERDARSPVPAWMLAVVGAVAAAVLAVTVVMWATTDRGSDEGSSGGDGLTSQGEQIEQGAAEALSAAELASQPVLSYDYRTFDESLADAEAYLTSSYLEQHRRLMGQLRDDAVSAKAVVRAEFMGSGITAATPTHTDILILVNQVIERTDGRFVLPVWATLRMVEQDGEWLVDEIVNEGATTG